MYFQRNISTILLEVTDKQADGKGHILSQADTLAKKRCDCFYELLEEDSKWTLKLHNSHLCHYSWCIPYLAVSNDQSVGWKRRVSFLNLNPHIFGIIGVTDNYSYTLGGVKKKPRKQYLFRMGWAWKKRRNKHKWYFQEKTSKLFHKKGVDKNTFAPIVFKITIGWQTWKMWNVR